MKLTDADSNALQQLEDEPHGYSLQRFSRATNVIDLTDRRLKEYARSQREIGENHRGILGIDIYACKIGRKQRQFGRTVAEAIKAALRGVPIQSGGNTQ
jgi:hypothetical protein